MSIGENIRKIRKSKKMSGETLGTAVGVSPQAILQYERGVREPKKEMLEKIANNLGCSIADLYGWNSEDTGRLSKEVKLIELIEELYPNDAEFILELFSRLGLMDTEEN